MKYLLALIICSLFVSCTKETNLNCREPDSNNHTASKEVDIRCDKIISKALIEAHKSGFCYIGPLFKGIHPEAIDPDPEKCDAFFEEAGKKCDALPPPNPDDIEKVSDSAIYHKGRKVSQNDKPICD